MKFELPISERELLRRFQRNVERRPEYVKVTSLLMLNKGYRFSEISDCLGIDSSTIHLTVHPMRKMV